MTNQRLNLGDLKQGNYVPLLEPEAYYTHPQTIKISRQSISNNLLGNPLFCPVVRKTPRLAYFEKTDHKEALIALQNRTVDSRFQDIDYRSSQNYVGETVNWERETIHFVPPKPEDLGALAAIIAYGFVFLHPFEDENGRIHRFLLHNILAKRKFTPQGIMFPLSAAMLKNLSLYEASLDAFSKKLMPLVNYHLSDY